MCSYLLPRNCSLQIDSHIFHCVFTWLGRNIGSPWCRSHSVRWNRTGIWWHPGEKSHIQISDFTFPRVPYGWRDFSFDLAKGLAVSPSDHLLVLAVGLLCLSHTLCAWMLKDSGPQQNPETCHAFHIILQIFLITSTSTDLHRAWNWGTFQYATIQYNITQSSPQKPAEVSWCLV